jgi:predicted PurR-regulated permease PerM
MNPNPPAVTSPPWTPITKRTIVLVCLVVFGVVLWQIADVLPLVVVSAVLAFLFNPLTTLLERRVLAFLPGARIWAILLTFIIAILLLLLAVPELARSHPLA